MLYSAVACNRRPGEKEFSAIETSVLTNVQMKLIDMTPGKKLSLHKEYIFLTDRFDHFDFDYLAIYRLKCEIFLFRSI